MPSKTFIDCIARSTLFTGSEVDRENECQIGVGNVRWRRWQRRGALDHRERLVVQSA
jgi:hypothetical protein